MKAHYVRVAYFYNCRRCGKPLMNEQDRFIGFCLNCLTTYVAVTSKNKLLIVNRTPEKAREN